MDRVMPGIVALLVGALLAIALLVPFVAISYRRRGGLTASRTLAWLALLLWILGLQAYTLLPIPSGPYACAGMELDPLQTIRDVIDPENAAAGALRNPAVQQLALNVLLFLPWGVLVRMLWRRGVVVAGLTGLGISLLVETTQLTGVWGLFPCAYRLFDTGDLASNTLGAVLGSLAAYPALRRRAVPSPAGAGRVTLPRRLIGMVCDVLVVWGTTAAVSVAGNALQLYVLRVDRAALDPGLSGAVGAIAAFVLSGVVVLASGTTVGEAAVGLRGVDGRHPRPLWRTVRFLAGIGGFQLLGEIPGWGGAATIAFAVVAIVVAWRSPQHRGLAQLAAGMRLRLVDPAAGAAQSSSASQRAR